MKQYATDAHFLYLAEHWTRGRDEDAAVGRVRGMALRDLADKVAADLCRE